MAKALTPEQLCGLDDSHLVSLPCGNRLQRESEEAFNLLRADALKAGFDLAIASSYRSFARQLTIWNGKVCGERAVLDDAGCDVVMDSLSQAEKLKAILRFSAIPGTSRHHWGTDIDVFDAAAMPSDYHLQLTPQEVAPGGIFDALHCWLDEKISQNQSRGFYRPYAIDREGVAVERWHLSFAPLSRACAQDAQLPLNLAFLKEAWSGSDDCAPLLLREEIEANWQAIQSRYVLVPDDWCNGVAV